MKTPEKMRGYNKKWYHKDVEKTRASKRARYRANLDHNRARARKAKWRREGYPEPTRPEPENCEGCGKSKHKKSLHLDHDHVTGKFRGWLCSNCNRGLGYLGDSLDGVAKMVDYLCR